MSYTIGNLNLSDSSLRERIPANIIDRCGQGYPGQLRAIGKHIVAKNVVRSLIALVVSIASSNYADFFEVEFRNLSRSYLFAEKLDIGSVDKTSQPDLLCSCFCKTGECSCRSHMNGICRPSIRRAKTDHSDNYRLEEILDFLAFHISHIGVV